MPPYADFIRPCLPSCSVSRRRYPGVAEERRAGARGWETLPDFANQNRQGRKQRLRAPPTAILAGSAAAPLAGIIAASHLAEAALLMRDGAGKLSPPLSNSSCSANNSCLFFASPTCEHGPVQHQKKKTTLLCTRAKIQPQNSASSQAENP